MADGTADSASASEIESDTDSTKLPPVSKREELETRLASLEQENRVLKIELETYKMRCKSLQNENKELRKASVNIVSAFHCNEFISDTSPVEHIG